MDTIITFLSNNLGIGASTVATILVIYRIYKVANIVYRFRRVCIARKKSAKLKHLILLFISVFFGVR